MRGADNTHLDISDVICYDIVIISDHVIKGDNRWHS